MTQVLHIARREWLEQRRQPVMLAVIAVTFGLLGGLCVLTLGLVQSLAGQPHLHANLAATLPQLGPADTLISSLAGTVIGIANWLLFGQFLGITAVLAGHSVLHDRQSGTLPFLLLAPVSRVQLLLGKVLGAMGPSLLIYGAITLVTALLLCTQPVAAPYADQLPLRGAWWVAFVLGGPSWALFVALLCALISYASHDVRTAQQGVWFVVLFASFLCGIGLSVLLSQGLLTQLVVAGTGALAAVGTLFLGAQVISRELQR